MINLSIKRLIVLMMVMVVLLAAVKAYAKREEPRETSFTSLPSLCESIGEIYAVKCKNNPRLRKFGCDDIGPPSIYLGELKPYLPMGVCMYYRGPAVGPAVRFSGCKLPIREQYIVLVPSGKKDEVKLIKDKEEFRRFFAPIEDGNEAIGYVAALTHSFPIFDFAEKYCVKTMAEGGKYTVSNPKPTDIEERKDGFLIRLFETPSCGCHRPELNEVTYFVSRDGYITQKGKKKTIWQADRLYQICID